MLTIIPKVNISRKHNVWTLRGNLPVYVNGFMSDLTLSRQNRVCLTMSDTESILKNHSHVLLTYPACRCFYVSMTASRSTRSTCKFHAGSLSEGMISSDFLVSVPVRGGVENVIPLCLKKGYQWGVICQTQKVM